MESPSVGGVGVAVHVRWHTPRFGELVAPSGAGAGRPPGAAWRWAGSGLTPGPDCPRGTSVRRGFQDSSLPVPLGGDLQAAVCGRGREWTLFSVGCPFRVHGPGGLLEEGRTRGGALLSLSIPLEMCVPRKKRVSLGSSTDWYYLHCFIFVARKTLFQSWNTFA